MRCSYQSKRAAMVLIAALLRSCFGRATSCFGRTELIQMSSASATKARRLSMQIQPPPKRRPPTARTTAGRPPNG